MAKSKEEVVQEFRVQSIQDAAMRVIARKGMSSATMAEIADEAGVAKGTIYLYFRDRDELVEKTFESAISELHRNVDSMLAGDAPFEEKLRVTLRAGSRRRSAGSPRTAMRADGMMVARPSTSSG